MQKGKYFDSEKFVNDALGAMKLGETNAVTLLALREEMENLLSDRIVGTVIGSMDKNALQTYNNILEDHPELDEMDALMMLLPSIDGLKDKLERAINSLYNELVYDAERIGKELAAA
jgi:hypothetical protein